MSQAGRRGDREMRREKKKRSERGEAFDILVCYKDELVPNNGISHFLWEMGNPNIDEIWKIPISMGYGKSQYRWDMGNPNIESHDRKDDAVVVDDD